MFPKYIDDIKAPPLKIHGIKLKLVRFIGRNIVWDGKGKWYEPFLGSGAVSFNLRPKLAVLSDNNPHIINFYLGLQRGSITKNRVKKFLLKYGRKLKNQGPTVYYEIRDRFNTDYQPLDFLFLNRTCYNGLIRFNRKGEFNVPFSTRINRFTRAYVEKVVEQISWVSILLKKYNWILKTSDWHDVVISMKINDFAYLDPPYINKETRYYNYWTEEDEKALINWARDFSGRLALSTWEFYRNTFNHFLQKYWLRNNLFIKRTISHKYLVGDAVSRSNKLIECLVIKSI